ncbi:MAG TPA: ribosome silencing factor [Thermodesulfovibrionales bacterium]|nr:ribosome silencing factor [Thermodesulfovibrionales bacterium]
MHAAESALAKKATDTIVLDLRGLAFFTDFFVICSGASTTQVKAIVEHIEEELHKESAKPLSIEGLNHAHWVLVDYGDVVVHVFEEETRAYYELEKLWLDAQRVIVDESGPVRPGKELTPIKSERPAV